MHTDNRDALEYAAEFCNQVMLAVGRVRSLEEFVGDPVIQNSVLFALGQIGEIVKTHLNFFENVSESVPWKK